MNSIAAAIIMFAVVIGAGFGMCFATSKAVDAAARQPEAAGRIQTLLLLGCALAESIGLYGFIIAIFVLIRTGLLSGTVAQLTWQQGLLYFVACLPIAVCGLLSGIHQGKVAAAGVSLVAKKNDQSGRAITMASLVEFYAILPFLISFLAVFRIG